VRIPPEHAGFLLSWLNQEKCSGEDPPIEPVARLQQLEVDTDTMKESLSAHPGEAASDDQHTRTVGAVLRLGQFSRKASALSDSLGRRRPSGRRTEWLATVILPKVDNRWRRDIYVVLI
jgi:hypothetical protein